MLDVQKGHRLSISALNLMIRQCCAHIFIVPKGEKH